MSPREPLGIRRVAALHRYCHSLDGNRRFLSERLDFAEVGASTTDHEERTRERSAIFAANDCVVVCSEPLSDRSPSGRYLKRHPEGVGAIDFEVDDIDRAFRVLDARGGTPISEIQTTAVSDGEIRWFSITTPLDDVLFTFIERRGTGAMLPGYRPHDVPRGGKNKYGFRGWDHITSNFQTIAPAILWMEHVLGFERYWDIEFHTVEGEPQKSAAVHGSGLRSVVMWDPKSGVRFANNEPFRPNFEASQVAMFCDDQRGAGVQHAAILVDDIMKTVPNLREHGVRFARAPDGYYENLVAHLRDVGVDKIDESFDHLRHAEILVDGEGPGRYLLQIFMEDAARFEGDLKKSPFFFELIQRKGDKGFGAGNFRALFEGVEVAQRGRIDAAVVDGNA